MRIVLVEPQHPGNIGAVARVMANFGLNDLVMVKGCGLADESYARSKSGRPILEKSKRYSTIEEAIADCDIAIGTSGIRPEGDKRWFRAPQDVKKIIDTHHLQKDALLLTTEKDAQKLVEFENLNGLPIYFLNLSIDFLWNKDKFDKKILTYVRGN